MTTPASPPDVAQPFCEKCGADISQQQERALDGNTALVWHDGETWICPVDGDEHSPEVSREQRVAIDARFDAEAKQLSEEITSSIDMVRWFAQLDPDEWGMGQPAYSPDTRALIRKCQAWQERLNAWEGLG